ncbi:unnamed protein product [Haemonchus placei]|uniref:Uncharacterized protein n=1 Tax=Haemonchus placei TaxID=6290 RepID=A0A0N4X544_HAEPC|nr:unnamed protein product [Haemonchus placei]
MEGPSAPMSLHRLHGVGNDTPLSPCLYYEPLIKPVAVDARSPTDKTQESTDTAKSFKYVKTRSRSNEALLSPNLLAGAEEPKMHTAIAMDKDGEEEKEVATAKLIDDEETKGVSTAKLINSEEDKEHTAILYKSAESKTPPTARLASPEDLKEQRTQSKEWDLLPEKKTQEGSREWDLLPEKKTQDSREIETSEVRSVPLYDPIVYSNMQPPRTKKSTSRIIPISRKKRGKKEESVKKTQEEIEQPELEQLDVDVSGRRRSRSRLAPGLPEDGGDLVLEFPVEEHDDDMITRNYLSFPPTVILSRQGKRPVFLTHDPSKPEVANISAAEFIDSLHVCKNLEDSE